MNIASRCYSVIAVSFFLKDVFLNFLSLPLHSNVAYFMSLALAWSIIISNTGKGNKLGVYQCMAHMAQYRCCS